MTYFTFLFVDVSPLPDNNPAVFSIVIEADMNRITDNRVVYGIFNWMSDVGGFNSIILLVASVIVGRWNTLELENFLTNKIFKDEQNRPFKLWGPMCCRKREQRARTKTMKRIEREVDVVRFVRFQLLSKAMLRKLDKDDQRKVEINKGKFIIPEDHLSDSSNLSEDPHVPELTQKEIIEAISPIKNNKKPIVVIIESDHKLASSNPKN